MVTFENLIPSQGLWADSPESIRGSHANHEYSLCIDARFKKKPSFCETTFQKKDSSENWTRINRREDAIRTNLAKCFKNKCFFLRIDLRESAKRWCANRRTTKIPTNIFRLLQIDLVTIILKTETITFREMIRKIIYPTTETVIFRNKWALMGV